MWLAVSLPVFATLGSRKAAKRQRPHGRIYARREGREKETTMNEALREKYKGHRHTDTQARKKRAKVRQRKRQTAKRTGRQANEQERRPRGEVPNTDSNENTCGVSEQLFEPQQQEQQQGAHTEETETNNNNKLKNLKSKPVSMSDQAMLV